MNVTTFVVPLWELSDVKLKREAVIFYGRDLEIRPILAVLLLKPPLKWPEIV